MGSIFNSPFSFISVIIPMRNEAKFIEKCVKSVLDQNYSKSRFEIIIIDGMSTDSSKKIVANLVKKNSNIRLFDNPGMTTPAGLNIGIKNAKGEVITRVDAHSYIASDYLQKIVNSFNNEQIMAVGGPVRKISSSFLSETINLALSSPFGIGGGLHWYSKERRFVDTVFRASYRKEIFDIVGYFDETMIYAEDEELNWRIRKAGYKIVLSPEIKCYYYPRSSIGGLFKQYYDYGSARVKVIRKHPDFFRIKHIIPSAFILSLIGNGILAVFNVWFLWLFLGVAGSYLIISLAFSALISQKKGWRYFGLLPISFACLHFGYGIGFLCRLFTK